MSADISKLREWYRALPELFLPDETREPIWRVRPPELEALIAAHTKQAQLDLLGELEEQFELVRETRILDAPEISAIPLTALQAKRKELEDE